MKSIIDGKTYNTETAKLVARGNNGLNINDCYYRDEHLYRTKKGNYFIFDSRNKIVCVDTDGKLRVDSSLVEISTIIEWLERWNVNELEEQEIKYFNIDEA